MSTLKYIPFEKFPKLENRLRKIIKVGTTFEQRDALAVVIGLHGLRVEEVSNLTVGDVDPWAETLRVETIKGGVPRTISLGDGVAQALRPYLKGRDASDPLFATGKGEPVFPSHLQRFVRKISRVLFGGDGLNFHMLRHTCAVRLYHRCHNEVRVRTWLGHSSANNTFIYIKAYGLIDERRLERLGPRKKFVVLPSLADRGKRGDAPSRLVKRPKRRGGRRGPAGAGHTTEEPFARSVRKGERELFDTNEKTTIPRDPGEKSRNAGAKTRSEAKSTTKATRFGMSEIEVRRPKSKPVSEL